MNESKKERIITILIAAYVAGTILYFISRWFW